MSRDLMHDSMIKAMDSIRSFLYYIDGFSHKEIARALNITEGGSTSILATRRRHRFLTVAISIPAAAAVLLLLFLLPINRTPAGQTAQNNPEPLQEELQATTDSISNPVDSVIDIIAEPVPVKNKVAMTSVATPVRMSNDTVSFNQDTYRQQLDSMFAR